MSQPTMDVLLNQTTQIQNDVLQFDLTATSLDLNSQIGSVQLVAWLVQRLIANQDTTDDTIFEGQFEPPIVTIIGERELLRYRVTLDFYSNLTDFNPNAFRPVAP